MANQSIYTVGGTIAAGEGLYITRRADQELLKLCRTGSFAYVLSSRQIGKSSLMVRTAHQLAEEGIVYVIIDLSQLGVQDITPEQWYLGLLTAIVEDLELPLEPVEWWQARSHLGIIQRFALFFQRVLLAEVTEQIVIFIDEIDSTLSLDFTDDFFAVIRSFYNARASEPEFQRLSFVLIGTATPSELMQDSRRTPFNIGRRVELTDFTFEEARPLARGLGLPTAASLQALGWVLDWTGGHPYLTQRLCREIAMQGQQEWDEADVERVVDQIFFGERPDDNLQFITKMLTDRSRVPDLPAVLNTYRAVRQQLYPVPDDEKSPAISHLKLSGIVRREGSSLRVRNRIYEQAFDLEWLEEAVVRSKFVDPQELDQLRALMKAKDDQVEAERQRAEAERRRARDQARATAELRNRSRMLMAAVGLLIALSIILIGLGMYARTQATTAQTGATQEAIAKQTAQAGATGVAIANQTAEAGIVAEAIARQTAQAGEAQAATARANAEADSERAIEAEATAQAGATQEAIAKQTAQAGATGEALARQTAAAGSTQEALAKGTAEAESTRALNAESTAQAGATQEANARQTAQAESTRAVNAESTAQAGATQEAVARATADANAATAEASKATAESQAGELAKANEELEDKAAEIAEAHQRLEVAHQSLKVANQSLASQGLAAQALSLQDAQYDLALLLSMEAPHIKDTSEAKASLLSLLVANSRLSFFLQGHGRINDGAYSGITSIAIGPNGRYLASGGSDRRVILWDLDNHPEPLQIPFAHLDFDEGPITSLAFAPSLDHQRDHQRLAFGAQQGAIWLSTSESATNIEPILEVRSDCGTSSECRDKYQVKRLVFSPDGEILTSLDRDGTVNLWNGADGAHQMELPANSAEIRDIAFNPDAEYPELVTANNKGKLIFWKIETGQQIQQIGEFVAHETSAITSIAYSPKGHDGPLLLASGDSKGVIKIWNLSQGPPQIISDETTNSSPWERFYCWFLGLFSGLFGWGCSEEAPTKPEPDLWIEGHTNDILRLAFSPNGEQLASSSRDATTRLWNVENGQQDGDNLAGYRGFVYDLAFLDNRYLVTGSIDNFYLPEAKGALILWNLGARQRLATRKRVSLPNGRINSGALNVTDNRIMLAVGSKDSDEGDSKITLWRITPDKGTQKLDELSAVTPFKSAYPLSFSPDGTKLAYTECVPAPKGSKFECEQSRIGLWEWQADSIDHLQEIDQAETLPRATFSRDGQLLAFDAGCTDYTPECQNRQVGLIKTDPNLRKADPIIVGTDSDEPVLSMAFSPEGDNLIAGLGSKIYLWDVRPVADGNPLQQLDSSRKPRNGVNSFAFLPKANSIVACGIGDNNIELWDISGGKLKRIEPPLIGHSDIVWSVDFSPDGQWLASGGNDGTVRLWDMPPQIELLTAANDDQPVNTRYFSSPLISYLAPIPAVAFSPPSSEQLELVAVGRYREDLAVYTWEVSREVWEDKACRIANRNLTQTEWKQYIGADRPYCRICAEFGPNSAPECPIE